MNTCPDLLAALKLRLRDLQLDAVSVKSRIEEIVEIIASIEGSEKRKRGRPPGPRAVFTPRRPNSPLHVAGGINVTDPDDDNGDAA